MYVDKEILFRSQIKTKEGGVEGRITFIIHYKLFLTFKRRFFLDTKVEISVRRLSEYHDFRLIDYYERYD